MSRKIERPREALLRLLSEHGFYNITSKIWLNRSRIERLGFQALATEMLVRELFIIPCSVKNLKVVSEDRYRGRKFRILLGKNGNIADSCLSMRASQNSLSWKELLDLLPEPPFPLFVVDVSLKYIHTEEELERLRLQIAVSLSVLREYLWDKHLAVTSADTETAQWLNEYMGRNKAIITDSKPNEVLWSLGADTVIILRPDAPETLTSSDVMKADAFLIGGVVDLMPRRGLSRILDNLVPWGIPRKIALKGSVIGVPERINRIIEILLKARYLYKGNIEKAIISSMSKRDMINRAFVEIMKNSYACGKIRCVSWDLYKNLKKWLPISEEEFKLAASKAKVKIEE
jgi:tRNA (adenine9-N1/guanine9-N1)-methyltransferase